MDRYAGNLLDCEISTIGRHKQLTDWIRELEQYADR